MEIININIGQAGCRIADPFWQALHTQHCSQSEPQGQIGTFFSQHDKEFHPRSLFLDTNQHYPELTDGSSSVKHKPENVIVSEGALHSIYPDTMYNWDPNFKESIMDRIRKEMEYSDGVGGVIFISSLAGGTGSGLTAAIQSEFRALYPSKIVQNFRLVPSLDSYCHATEIYHSSFAMHQEVQCSDMTMLFDNSATSQILAAEGSFRPSFQVMNQAIGQTIADSTIPFRFKGDLNTSQRKMCMNLVMFPRMHFMPFARSTRGAPNVLTSALNPKNCFLSNTIEKNAQLRHFCVYAGIRSHGSSQSEIHSTITSQFAKRNYPFLEWIGDNVHMSIHSPVDRENATIFYNGFHIKNLIKQLGELFTVSFRRKAFVHHYTSAGMDQMEFTQAESNLNDLYSQYCPCQYGAYDEDYDQMGQEEIQQ